MPVGPAPRRNRPLSCLECESRPFGEVVSPGRAADVLVPVAIVTRMVTGCIPRTEIMDPGSVTRIAGDFSFPALRLTSDSQIRPGATPSAEVGEICLRPSGFRCLGEGARLPAVPDLLPLPAIILEQARRSGRYSGPLRLPAVFQRTIDRIQDRGLRSIQTGA